MVCGIFTEELMFDFILCNPSWNINLSYVKHLSFSKFSKQMTVISPQKINCMNELCYVISVTYLKKRSIAVINATPHSLVIHMNESKWVV